MHTSYEMKFVTMVALGVIALGAIIGLLAQHMKEGAIAGILVAIVWILFAAIKTNMRQPAGNTD